MKCFRDHRSSISTRFSAIVFMGILFLQSNSTLQTKKEGKEESSWNRINIANARFALKFLHLQLDSLYSDIMQGSITDIRFWSSACLILLLLGLFDFLLRSLIGSASKTVLAILSISLVQWKIKSENALQHPTTSNTSSESPNKASSNQNSANLNKGSEINTSDFVHLNSSRRKTVEEEEFPGEFWYPLDGKQASFHHRGKPYFGRTKKQKRLNHESIAAD